MSAALQWAAIIAGLAVLWFAAVAVQPWRRRWPRSPMGVITAALGLVIVMVGWAILAGLALSLVYAATHGIIGATAATLLGAVPAVLAGILLIRRRRQRRGAARARRTH